MNRSEHLELIELVFDTVEQDRGLHGSYELYPADGDRIRLDLLNLAGDDEQEGPGDVLARSLKDPHTARVLHRILDTWARVYARYDLLHTIWEQVENKNLDMRDLPKLMEERTRKDLRWLETVFYFDDWFERFDSWTMQDRQELVEQITTFMDAIKDLKETHCRLRKRALQELLEGIHPTIDLEQLKTLLQKPSLPIEPWDFTDIESCWTVHKVKGEKRLWLKQGCRIADGFRAILSSPDAIASNYEMPTYGKGKYLFMNHDGKPFIENTYEGTIKRQRKKTSVQP
ncbi:MAG: hypothetical protein EOM68_21140 [Spirochaetia bacterium]|nr:hypothetical protein [Spirochaetia bacterium]